MTSIIIPHYNRSELLKETLKSVMDQSNGDWEVIVVDDQSSHTEWKTVKDYENIDKRIKVLKRKVGIKGPSACRNIGVEEAKGDYLLFLDSDDLLSPFCIEQRVRTMEKNQKVDVGVFQMYQWNPRKDDKRAIFNSIVGEDEWISAFINGKNPWNITCPIWRKEVFQNVGGFDENFLFMEDPELHLRALNKGIHFKTFYDLPPDCFYRINHQDETKSDFYRNSIYYRIRFYELIFKDYSSNFISKYIVDIKTGINTLIKKFLYSRKNQFPELYDDLISVMEKSGIYTKGEIKKYRRLIEWGNMDNRVLRALKIKGICYRMLP